MMPVEVMMMMIKKAKGNLGGGTRGWGRGGCATGWLVGNGGWWYIQGARMAGIDLIAVMWPVKRHYRTFLSIFA